MNAASPALGEALPDLKVGPLELDHSRAYAAASLDDNPLHLDPAAARAVGLDAPVLHGMLLMGLFERALAGWRPELRVERLHATFLRPVPAGSRVTVGGRIAKVTPEAAGTRLVVRVTVRDEANAMACVGEVFARLGTNTAAA